jgi:hypothetical protein
VLLSPRERRHYVQRWVLKSGLSRAEFIDIAIGLAGPRTYRHAFAPDDLLENERDTPSGLRRPDPEVHKGGVACP